jgi:hypothetical protein
MRHGLTSIARYHPVRPGKPMRRIHCTHTVYESASLLRASVLAPALALALGVTHVACGGAEAATGPQGDGGQDALTEGGSVEAGDETEPEASVPWLAVPLSACVPSEYTAPTKIGATQSFNLAIDTGSTTLGVASSSCTNCDVTPLYSPGSTATNENQKVDAEYGSGEWSGEVYLDSVTVGPEEAVPVKLGAIDSQMEFFTPASCTPQKGVQGILGLGPAGAAEQGTNGYFDDLVSTAKVPNIFAVQLCDSSGTLWLGGYDPAATTAAPVYTPLSAELENYYYAVNLASITVNGTSIPVATTSEPYSIVDTGTSIFILPTPAYTSLTNAITADAGFQAAFGNSASTFFSGGPGNCLAVSKTKAELDAALPPLTLTFGTSAAVTVQAAPTESYLIQQENSWCSALYGLAAGSEGPIAGIMGSPVLRSNVVIFDRANKRIGFAPHTACN